MNFPRDAETRRSPPLRVAHIVRPSAGGIRSQVRTLIAGMPEDVCALAGPEDVVRALAPTLPLSLAASVTPEETGLFVVPPVTSLGDLLRMGRRIGAWAVERRGATLLHGHGLRWTPLFAAARAAATGQAHMVVTLHNLVPASAARTPLHRLALNAALHRADRIVAVSEAVAESARRVLDRRTADRVVVVRNGIDLAAFNRADASAREAARASLGVPEDAPVVLCVARLSPEKAVGVLIEAFARLKGSPAGAAEAAATNVRLLIVGEGPERDALQALIQERGLTDAAQLLGARDDVARLLQGGDVFCLPSREEGLGIAVIEAMAAGLPVVATTVGGIPEVVRAGETGLLVPPDDPEATAAALGTVLRDIERARAMGRAGRERAHGYFSAAVMVEATRDVYAEALGL